MPQTQSAYQSRLRTFFSYYKPYTGLLLADLVCAFILAAVTLALPLLARHITSTLLGENTPDPLPQIATIAGLMLLLVAMYVACGLFVDYRGHMMGAYIEADMRRDLFDHYQRLPFRFYDENRTGQLMSRITNDLFWISEFAHHAPEDVTISIVKFIGTFIILLTVNVPLTLLLFLFLPVMLAYSLYFSRRVNRALEQTKVRVGDINAQVEDTLAGIRVVQSFTNEGVERAKFAGENARFVASRGDGYRSEAAHYWGLMAFGQIIPLAVIVLGAIWIVGGSLNLADLLTYLLYVAIFLDPIQRMVNFARLYQEGITGFNRFIEIMQVAPEIADAPGARDLAAVQGEIEFREVRFRYREESEDVFRNLSLTIHAGEYVALVGPSGVGKTTLCSLIPRFYDVNDGCILVDEQDIRGVTLHSLRRQIGVVQQDVYLFAGTVAENIRYGRPDANDAEIVAAAKAANAHAFIMALPNGYETDIGQRGVRLSGGQKQRLSIARVFLKNPPILIFDEATSALDNESEGAVQASLERLTQQRTTLVIAHRLTTVRNAGRILVLTDDGIAEQGTHDELIAAGGVYARLYNTQLRL